MSTRLVVGPFNRVEGDLEVSLDVADGHVAAARVSSPLFRGFEHILAGRDPFDALALVPRICGICSVSQSAAAAAALRDAMGLDMPRNGALAANLILATENLADHVTHFYLFFMADFARDAYRGRPWFDAAQACFKAVEGKATAEALPARAAFLELLGILAGKWPHSMTLQPGGVARAVTATEKIRLYAMLREFRGWLERRLFGDALEAIAALDSAAALAAWQAARAPAASDFRLFLEIADDLALATLGRATDHFISYGAYALDGEALFAGGVWRRGDAAVAPLDHRDVAEEASHAWMADARPRHPWDGDTRVDGERENAYTWCKAPRLDGAVVECGALARQAVAGHPLARDLVASGGGNVAARVIARLDQLVRRRERDRHRLLAHDVLPGL
ncbi:MAG TPA: nickel-dependent hydrogenase large subunit, partial [Rhodocyclaceae bacterium]|nr:nickel-dependent hydrogenase large subunit [Rhodocyclaceae bacterium]